MKELTLKEIKNVNGGVGVIVQLVRLAIKHPRASTVIGGTIAGAASEA
ncbi:MAG: hypothetical protein AAGB12_16040 [Pseudomonadota bacterium]